MDGVSQAAVAQSVESVNQVLQMATKASTEQAEKLVKVTTEMALASPPGLGGSIDIQA